MDRSTSRRRKLLDRGTDLGFALALLLGALVPMFTVRAADPARTVVNEVLVHHVGDDTTEFVELYGVPGASLAGLSVVAVEGDGTSAGTIDMRVDLPADARLGGNGFYLLGNASGLAAHYGVVPDLPVTPSAEAASIGFLENGSQTVALVETAGLGTVGASLTGHEVALDSVGFWDAGGTDAWFFSAPVVELWEDFLPPGAHRLVDGQDTDTASDWALADYLLGAANSPTAATAFDAQPWAACGPGLAGVEGDALSAAVSAADPDGQVVAFSHVVAPAQASIGLGPTVPASGSGGVATTSVDVGTDTPSGTYVVTVTAWTDAEVAQAASCSVSVTLDPKPAESPPSSASVAALVAMVDGMAKDASLDASKEGQLLERLGRVDAMLAAGQMPAALAQLQAFANQVAGFAPKWITPDAASQLAGMAAELSASLTK